MPGGIPQGIRPPHTARTHAAPAADGRTPAPHGPTDEAISAGARWLKPRGPQSPPPPPPATRLAGSAAPASGVKGALASEAGGGVHGADTPKDGPLGR